MNLNLPNIWKKLQTFWGLLALSLLVLGLAASVILVTERQEIRKEAAAPTQEVCTWQDDPDRNLSHFGRCGNFPVMGAACEQGQVSVYCTIQDCIIPDQYVQVADCKCICGTPPPTPTPRPTPNLICTWQDDPEADYNYLAWCGYQPVMGTPCDQGGQTDICTEPCNPGSMVQDFDCKCICDGPMPENCNSECVSQGFASGYCDSANIPIICETDETNIGWTQDCVAPPDIPGIFRGCCCIPLPTPTATPTPTPISPPLQGCFEACQTNEDCLADLDCGRMKRCVNPSCPNDPNCVCELGPTPTPIGRPTPTPTGALTPTPTPTGMPTPTPTPPPEECWLTGDFNCDGEVDLLDFEMFRDIYVEHLE